MFRFQHEIESVLETSVNDQALPLLDQLSSFWGVQSPLAFDVTIALAA